ncbi:cytochrome ubiquinol oxidase subunit I [Shimazuella sp. AN120528]|uniref:cytochrome ubiquinol oxidase subunit I n=1 Tax=Shimazuella soli TaxID=1892854 RepID=UPI001F0E7F84|nr:cytochrome ubiquinol oxidase subunit I [Shimazuella soli]MCH5583434.1 cytochrome ubiquinol oxidase subunit I [Shimazuella soli]
MDQTTITRAFFGTSLAFHIIFATLAVGISFMILVSEIIYQRTKDKDYELMAKRWTKAFAILLGVGIPSGTIVGVQLTLLWPGFMKIVGQVISIPFQIEIFAFFLEALFMSIYVYAADRLSGKMRVLSVFFVSVGATASATLITSANTWMNTPAGFDMYADGTIKNVNTWAAFFNPSYGWAAFHVAISAFMAGAFAIASVSAYRYLKTPTQERKVLAFHRKSLFVSLVVGFVMSAITALSGHGSAQGLYEHSPEKLAAAEGLFKTQRYAPLSIGGYTDPTTHEVKYDIEIPYALSILAGNWPSTEVKGLYEFPEETWPPFYVHTLFNIMVGIGMLLLALSFIALAYWWFFHHKKQRAFPNWLVWILVASGPLAMLGIEFGWIFSCSGRQPWTIYGFQRTSEAATKAAHVGNLFVLFGFLYLLLSVLVVAVMRIYFKRNPLAKELAKRGDGHVT